MNYAAILVFLKNPVRSTVKTRLALSLGDDPTLGLYRRFVMDTVEKADASGEVTLCFQSDDGTPPNDLLTGNRRWAPQRGEDLGERMAHGFRSAFERGYDKVLLVGTDAPDMPKEHYREAFDELDRHDAVIGPARDGGYLLIGFRKSGFSAEVFNGVSWSTETVLEKTLEILSENRLSCHKLPLWYDVDTGEDFKALVRRLKSGVSTASHTWDFIRRFKMDTHETSHLGHSSCSE